MSDDMRVYNPTISKDKDGWYYGFIFRDSSCTTSHNVIIGHYTGGLVIVEIDGNQVFKSSPLPIWRAVVARLKFILTLKKFRKEYKEYNDQTEFVIGRN